VVNIRGLFWQILDGHIWKIFNGHLKQHTLDSAFESFNVNLKKHTEEHGKIIK